MRVRFGSFVLDFEGRQLDRGGHPIHLTPKAFELLELLVDRRPHAVSKAEIHDRIWPDTFVADVNLPVLVHELREALEDDPHEPVFLRTVTRFGYAFCAPARPEPEAPEWAARCPRRSPSPRRRTRTSEPVGPQGAAGTSRATRSGPLNAT